MDTTVEGVDASKVTDWFVAHVPGAAPPLRFDLLAGGRSNLTFRVDDTAGHTWVLRRPPLNHVLATAHDMSREHRIISALGPTDVPVAHAIGLCSDAEVNGSPFYVMSYVDGHVVRDKAEAKRFTTEQRRRTGESIIDTLARIHAVDIDAVGLGELGRREGYIARQLKRWYGQWEQSKTRELPDVDVAYERLKASIPEQAKATIVHGDYRLDNCMVDDSGEVIAVLDWEICTLGDPLADVGLLMVYWSESDEKRTALPEGATGLDGYPPRADLLARYANISGRDVSMIDFYMAFGYWKLACILEGVYARYVGGAMGQNATNFDFFAEQVRMLAEAARSATDGFAG